MIFRPLLPMTLAALLIPAMAGAEPGLVAQGRLLYHEAIGADGTAVRAVVQNDVILPAGAGACVSCHRRSGIGVSEGGERSLNITAPVLFKASNKPPLRPAYDDVTLKRAIAAGIDSAGRPLDPTMPRYELSRSDLAALVAYLQTLGAEMPDGVSATELHIATILAPGATAANRLAVEQVLGKYVGLKNAETRLEARRAAASDRNYFGRSRQRAYREWVLHTWTLEGAEASWPAQLADFYDQTKPFVIVSGAVGSGWPMIHEFCERRELPCILPLTDHVPDSAPTSFYSLYFSTGVELQADVTARHLLQDHRPGTTRILVVSQRDPLGEAAARRLADKLADAGDFDLVFQSYRPARPPTQREWRALLRTQNADVLVCWLPAPVTSALVAGTTGAGTLPATIYSAEFVADWLHVPVSDKALATRLRYVYPYSLAQPGMTQFPREHLWLQQHALDNVSEIAAAKVLFAARALGLALADMQSSFSREYLLETFEHALDGSQLTSLYPRTALGPDQRLLARGAYVMRISIDRQWQFVDSVWVQP